MLRLNSRDYVRDRSAASNPDNALNLSSIRIEPSSDAFECKSGQAGVSVTMHRSSTLNFARNKYGHDVEPALKFEVPKPVTTLALLAPLRSTYSIRRMQVSLLSTAMVKRRSRARNVLTRSWRNSGSAREITFIEAISGYHCYYCSLEPLGYFILLHDNLPANIYPRSFRRFQVHSTCSSSK
jgi:hypothetical protein